MKDIFSSYHKHKVLSHISLITLSAIFAIGINLLLIQTPATQMLQANIMGNESIREKNSSDFSGFMRGNELIFQSHQEMLEVREFSFSLAYDPLVLQLGTYTTKLPANEISELKNEDGFVTYIINFENPINLTKESELIAINFEKLQEKTVFVNPISVNFTDVQDETYLLSSTQLQF